MRDQGVADGEQRFEEPDIEESGCKVEEQHAADRRVRAVRGAIVGDRHEAAIDRGLAVPNKVVDFVDAEVQVGE
jgi:hypothetical protein